MSSPIFDSKFGRTSSKFVLKQLKHNIFVIQRFLDLLPLNKFVYFYSYKIILTVIYAFIGTLCQELRVPYTFRTFSFAKIEIFTVL